MASTEPPTRQKSRALEAAQWLYETQKAQLAEDPNRPRTSITSTRAAAARFGTSQSTVVRHLAALKNGRPNASTGFRVGRPSRLTEVEKQMLSFHTFMLRREKRPVSMKVVHDAADALLSRKNPDALPVSGSWVRRWLREDRARAREEARSKANGTLPSAELVEAEVDNGDEDGDEDEDTLSESEPVDPNLNPSTDGNLFSSGTFVPLGR
ncbi:hypothetical protein F4801DRAFT_440575 [Xylaria longipes]|nr:hypothetical protein F4801DRAFT_440575 [Xylaria longipes]RYC61752.1 hypothetical protein CHU98_g4472 [Xylaria longipes]